MVLLGDRNLLQMCNIYVTFIHVMYNAVGNLLRMCILHHVKTDHVVGVQEGSMRCDVNVSVRPSGQQELGTKVEVKNMNSFSAMQKAIDFEIDRQVCALLCLLLAQQLNISSQSSLSVLWPTCMCILTHSLACWHTHWQQRTLSLKARCVVVVCENCSICTVCKSCTAYLIARTRHSSFWRNMMARLLASRVCSSHNRQCKYLPLTTRQNIVLTSCNSVAIDSLLHVEVTASNHFSPLLAGLSNQCSLDRLSVVLPTQNCT